VRALLDVNVLVALFDQDHVDHAKARDWLASEITSGWASCPITENGFVRVVSQPAYPSPITPAEAITLFAHAADTAHHSFWPNATSIADDTAVDRRQILGHRQVTDVCLLATAVANGGRLVTLDRTIPITAVAAATPANLHVL
jgi:toxin-antitoxin system PIN domain toxin